jgi:hypothetical protein
MKPTPNYRLEKITNLQRRAEDELTSRRPYAPLLPLSSAPFIDLDVANSPDLVSYTKYRRTRPVTSVLPVRRKFRADPLRYFRVGGNTPGTNQTACFSSSGLSLDNVAIHKIYVLGARCVACYCLKTSGGPLTRFACRSTSTSTRLAILMKGMPLFIP